MYWSPAPVVDSLSPPSIAEMRPNAIAELSADSPVIVENVPTASVKSSSSSVGISICAPSVPIRDSSW